MRGTDARYVESRVDEYATPYSGLTRLMDITVASVALILFLPLMAILAITILLTDPGAIIYAQRRIGRGGRRFSCLKFRTMCVDSEQRLRHLLATDPAARLEWDRDQKLRNDPRITGIGNFLRKTSLDELPQLFNVLRGDMSLVGPRPIVDAEIVRYGRHFDTYCRVRPGITGLWQISGRNHTTYRRRVAIDVSYVRGKCLMFDLRILAVTVPRVLLSRGAY